MMIKRSTKGFTLIELLVVIAIIGILSSVVLASLATARKKARDANRISDLKNVQLALELYYDGNQLYPDQAGAGNNTLAPIGAILVAANYLPVSPNDPTAGLTYYYVGLETPGGAVNTECVVGAVVSPACNKYVIAANLENTDNPVLYSDGDIVGALQGGLHTLGTTCTAALPDAVNGPGAAATEKCYSLVP